MKTNAQKAHFNSKMALLHKDLKRTLQTASNSSLMGMKSVLGRRF